MAETAAEREQRYRRVRDREPLDVLPGGLTVVRCVKHEAISFDKLTVAEIARLTGKRFGSKFASDWSLLRYVDWIAGEVARLGWTTETGPDEHVEDLDAPIGVSAGKPVHMIKLVSDGRYIHAYPVSEP